MQSKTATNARIKYQVIKFVKFTVYKVKNMAALRLCGEKKGNLQWKILILTNLT